MTIYKITADHDFWSLLPVQKEQFVKQTLFQLESMRSSWIDLSFYVRDPARTIRGDFFNLSLGCLAYGGRVNESDLGEIIERSGEMLKAKLDGTDEMIYVLNPTACYNCLDRHNTVAEWTPDGTVAVQVKKYAFHVDRIGDCNLFKIPEMKRVGLFAISGRDEPEDEFYAQYHDMGLTGLKFEEVWSDEVE
jgi:hypothetical protein